VNGIYRFGGLRVDVRIISKWILKYAACVRVWTGFKWLRIGTVGELLGTR
jgi:hypothetical protein